MYPKTIYTEGLKIHIHENRYGERIYCRQKHGKEYLPYFGLTLSLLLVEVVLGFLLMNKAW